MEGEYNNHSVIAQHNGESYFYKPCNQFDAVGLPKQFQDCAYVLKYLLSSKSVSDNSSSNFF